MRSLGTILAIFTLMLCVTRVTEGCDVCSVYDYSTIKNKSFVSLFHRYRVFNGYVSLSDQHSFLSPLSANSRVLHNPNTEDVFVNNSERDYESYSSTELRFNYNSNDKYNIQTIIPYDQNQVYFDHVLRGGLVQDSTTTLSGLGDVIVVFDLLKRKNLGVKKFRLIKPGIAFILPTGKWGLRGTGDVLYDPTIQPGSGAFGVVARLNYQYIANRIGVESGINYLFAGEGKQGYEFSNSVNNTSTFFYQFEKIFFKCIPKVGYYVESSRADNDTNGEVLLTGGTTWFVNVGSDFMYKNYTFQFLYQKPIIERLNGDQIGNAGRINLALIYNLN